MQSTAIRIAVAAFIASICFSFFILPALVESQHINTDPDRFGQLADNIARGNGFVYEQKGTQVLERTPLYALVLAGIFKLAGGFSLHSVQMLQAVLHGISSFIIYTIGLRLYQQRTAILAELLFALNPIALWYTARIWVETTQTLILLLIALAMIQLFELHSMKRAIALGLCIGLACLTKSTLLLFPFIMLLVLLYRFKDGGLKPGVIMLSMTFLVIMPWTWRNYQVTSSFLPVNTSLGFNIIQGDIIGEQWPSYEMTTTNSWVIGKERVDSILNPSRVPWESVEGDRILTTFAIQNYIRHPVDFVWRSVANLSTFWYLSESVMKSLLFGLLQISLLFTAILSCFKMNSSLKKSILPLIVLCCYLFFASGLIAGWGRYSMPMIPFLSLIASPLLRTIIPRRT